MAGVSNLHPRGRDLYLPRASSESSVEIEDFFVLLFIHLQHLPLVIHFQSVNVNHRYCNCMLLY